MINKKDIKNLQMKKINNKHITATIDEDLFEALQELSKKVPFSFATESILSEGLFFYVEKDKRLSDVEMEKFRRIKIDATINENLLSNLKALQEKSKCSFSHVLNYILRLGFIESLGKTQKNKIKIYEEENTKE
jgi:hypothetical protein